MADGLTAYEMDTETLGAVGETQQFEMRSSTLEFHPAIANGSEGLRTSLSSEPAPDAMDRQGNIVHI